MKMLMRTVALCGILLTTGCATKIGELAFYSTQEIDFSSSAYKVDATRKVSGEGDAVTCALGLRTSMPNMRSAVLRAEQSISNCVGIANVTINYKIIPYLFFNEQSFIVEGNPVLKTTK